MVQLFDTLNLACLVDSNPQASYYWKLNGTVVFSYQNYSILSMNNDNYGTYTCEASLKNYPKVTTSVKVIKPGPPIIDAVIEQYGSNGYETRIETVTENEPMANVRSSRFITVRPRFCESDGNRDFVHKIESSHDRIHVTWCLPYSFSYGT